MGSSLTPDLQKLTQLIKDVKFAMLTTKDGAGRLHSRPMTVQQIERDNDLWFFVNLTSPKIEQICREPQVNVSLAEPKDQRYVSIAGRAEVVRDREKAKQLWSPLYKAWFPRGFDDPELALLRVKVEHAEYWDAPSGTMIQLISLIKAAVTGYRSEDTENKKIAIA